MSYFKNTKFLDIQKPIIWETKAKDKKKIARNFQTWVESGFHPNNISPATLQRLIQEKALPPARIGGVFNRQAVESWHRYNFADPVTTWAVFDHLLQKSQGLKFSYGATSWADLIIALVEYLRSTGVLEKLERAKNEEIELRERAQLAALIGKYGAPAQETLFGDAVIICGTEDGDWYGLYINGEMKGQGHSIQVDSFITLMVERGQHIGGYTRMVDFTEKQMDAMGGRFPAKIEDIVTDVPDVEEETDDEQ